MQTPRRLRSAMKGPHGILLAVAAGRVTIGAIAFVRPRLVRVASGGRPLGDRAQALARMVGVRDLVLGAGALATASRGDVLGALAVLGAVSDAGDAAASLLAARAFDDSRRARWLTQAGIATASASVSAVAAALTVREARRRR